MANGAGKANCIDEYNKKGCEKCGGTCNEKRCELPKYLTD